MKFYPYENGGGGSGKGFSHAEVGAQKVLGSFYMVAWSLSHAEGGGGAKGPPLKGGRKKFYPVLRGGAKSFDPQFSHFVAPPRLLPVINDQSLTQGEYSS